MTKKTRPEVFPSDYALEIELHNPWLARCFAGTEWEKDFKEKLEGLPGAVTALMLENGRPLTLVVLPKSAMSHPMVVKFMAAREELLKSMDLQKERIPEAALAGRKSLFE